MSLSLRVPDLFDPVQFISERELVLARLLKRSKLRSQVLTNTLPPPLCFSARKHFYLRSEYVDPPSDEKSLDRDKRRERTAQILRHRNDIFAQVLKSLELLKLDQSSNTEQWLRSIEVPRLLKAVCTPTDEKPTLARFPLTYKEAQERIDNDEVLDVPVVKHRGFLYIDLRDLIRANIQHIAPVVIATHEVHSGLVNRVVGITQGSMLKFNNVIRVRTV